MARKIRVLKTSNQEIFLHHTLASVSDRLNERVLGATKDGPTDGWFLDAVAATVMLAFLNEAVVNAVGDAKVSGWNPKWSAEKRLLKIREAFFSHLGDSDPPFKTVHELRGIRNEFGHAMPLRMGPTTEEVIENAERSYNSHCLDHPVETQITAASFKRFVDDSKSFRDQLFEASGLTIWEVATKSEVSSTYLGEAD